MSKEVDELVEERVLSKGVRELLKENKSLLVKVFLSSSYSKYHECVIYATQLKEEGTIAGYVIDGEELPYNFSILSEIPTAYIPLLAKRAEVTKITLQNYK